MTLVVDAGAVAELLLARAGGRAVAAAMREHDFDLHAPHLLDVEVLHVIRRLVAAGFATAVRGEQAVDDLLALPLQRHPHDVLVRRAWQYRDNFSADDASYLALAEALADDPVPIVTTDARFARALRAHTDVAALLAG